MAIYTKEQAQALLKKVIGFSKAEQCEVNFNGQEGGNLRYALSSVSTSGGTESTRLEVTSAFGKKTGTATINEFDDASLQKVVKRSEDLAKLAPENPEFLPYLEPQTYADYKTFVTETAAIDPKYRAVAAYDSLQVAKTSKLTAAGFLENAVAFSAMMNSKGLFAYNQSTNVNFSVTLRTADGRGSGYASKTYNDVRKLNAGNESKIAADKAVRSVAAKAIEPGKYTVILEPMAAQNLLENMFNAMDARQADEGRSFLSKGGGKTRLGEQLVDEKVTIYSDPQNIELPSSTWSSDGRPQEKMVWIDKGVVKNMFYSRYWAEKKGVKGAPRPAAMIMQGGSSSINDLIKSTEKGILITRFWYIRAVDPQTLLYTGLTRDGTFYIENGEIKFPVKNFRFNESPVIMLNNLEALGVPERVGNMLIPPMKIRDFTFSSISDAV
jgi:predicted Zn-dependent protease